MVNTISSPFGMSCFAIRPLLLILVLKRRPVLTKAMRYIFTITLATVHHMMYILISCCVGVMFRCVGGHVVTHVEHPAPSWYMSQRLACGQGHSCIVSSNSDDYASAIMMLNHAIHNREVAICTKCWVVDGVEEYSSADDLETETGSEGSGSESTEEITPHITGR